MLVRKNHPSVQVVDGPAISAAIDLQTPSLGQPKWQAVFYTNSASGEIQPFRMKMFQLPAFALLTIQ